MFDTRQDETTHIDLTDVTTHGRGARSTGTSDAAMRIVMSVRNRKLAEWAAGVMDLSSPAGRSFADEIVMLGLSEDGEAAIIDRLTEEFAARSVDVSPEMVSALMAQRMLMAEREMVSEPRAARAA
jgi:hypothetical protein